MKSSKISRELPAWCNYNVGLFDNNNKQLIVTETEWTTAWSVIARLSVDDCDGDDMQLYVTVS